MPRPSESGTSFSIPHYAFVVAFREATEKLKAGNRNAAFPIGCFPPRLPFVSG
jgi:hypothetical protein